MADEIGVKAAAYMTLKRQIKELTDKSNEYRVDLEDYIDNNGKEDSKGHIIIVVSHAGQEFELKKESRVSSVQDPEIVDKLKANLGPVNLAKVIEKVEVVRDDVIEVLHEQGKISDELLSKLYSEKTIYAFKVKKL